ncbi:DUF2630 family protein [Pseudonocardia nantongensis]|uniref:DUF2630 family protein n=1 Tax=Pseudonocardia nantongensis TaxID=1181885 RepID=UPI00397AC3B9
MTDTDIQNRIGELIGEEHQLREQVVRGELSPGEESERLREVEARLDQCWDLLRQRRARREFHADPDEAAARPVREVENYRQ